MIVLNVARNENPRLREASMGSVLEEEMSIDESPRISEPEGSIESA